MADPGPVLRERLGDAFEAHRDPERAAGMSKYMRGLFPYYGISNPVLQRVVREASAGTAAPSEAQLRRFALACWKREEREWQYVACGYLRRHVSALSPAFLPTLRTLVTAKSWWDTIDTLAAHVAGPLVATHGMQGEMDSWIDDDNMWIVRVALLHQLGYKERTDTARLFDYCLRRADHPDFFVRKAVGWALRQYSWTDPAAVRTFLNRHGDALSPLSRREASKRL